ncbi:hypothetical protein STEG23_006482, partial [Scotinomys teguina]
MNSDVELQPSHVQSAGRVHEGHFFLNSGLFQMPLAVLSPFLSTVNSLTSWSCSVENRDRISEGAL